MAASSRLPSRALAMMLVVLWTVPVAEAQNDAGTTGEDGGEEAAPDDAADDAGDAAETEANAPPSQEEIAAAREAFGRGQEAFNNGDYAGAAAAYEEAYAIVPDPTILFNLGDARQRAEDYRGAVDAYETYLEKRPDADNKADVEGRIAQLREVPATLHITSTPTGASISVDGVQEDAVTPADVSVAPGEHIVSVTLPDYAPAFEEIDVEFATEQDIELTLEEAPEDEVAPGGAGAAVGAGAAAGGAADGEDAFSPSAGTWVAVGIAGAGLATGTVFGFLAMDRQSDFDDNPGTDAQDEGERFSLVADIAFGVGIAAGITALVLYLVEKSDYDAAHESSSNDEDGEGDGGGDGAEVSVSPVVGPSGGGLAAQIRF